MTPFHMFLALGMLITGSINTISEWKRTLSPRRRMQHGWENPHASTKAADQQYAVDSYGNKTQFNHPFMQAAGMFIGELLCLLAFRFLVFRANYKGEKIARAKPFNPLIFVLPALCDMTATSTMYLGLALTDASVFQMLRGSVIIFTSLLSVIFLKRKLRAYHWIGIVLVIGGTAIVGTQSKICPMTDASGTCPNAQNATGPSMSTIGNILVIVAQFIVAVQMVVEEKFIAGYDIPALEVVGFEGLWGFSVLSLVLVGMYYIKMPAFLVPPCTEINGVMVNTPAAYGDHFENTLDGFTMLKNNAGIALALVGNMLSIAFFNYFGVSVTKHVNASTRMVLDSVRTIIIWAVSLGLKWESFCWIQIIGFVILLAGTVIYNAILRIPRLEYPDAVAPAAAIEDETKAGLLASEAGSLNGSESHGHKDDSESGVEISIAQLMNTPNLRKAVDFKKR